MTTTIPTDAERRERTIEHEMAYCQHYAPEPLKIVCRAGVDMDKFERVPAGPSRMKMGPCIHGHTLENPAALCPHWVRRTREQGEARADRMEESMRRMRLVGPVVIEFRKKPWGKQGVFDCPACSTGKLHLSQSARNGHVWGRCTTEGCVSWME